MLPSIDTPQGDHVDRRPATTAIARPTATIAAHPLSLSARARAPRRTSRRSAATTPAPTHRRALRAHGARAPVHETEVRRHLHPEVLPRLRGLDHRHVGAARASRGCDGDSNAGSLPPRRRARRRAAAGGRPAAARPRTSWHVRQPRRQEREQRVACPRPPTRPPGRRRGSCPRCRAPADARRFGVGDRRRYRRRGLDRHRGAVRVMILLVVGRGQATQELRMAAQQRHDDDREQHQSTDRLHDHRHGQRAPGSQASRLVRARELVDGRSSSCSSGSRSGTGSRT